MPSERFLAAAWPACMLVAALAACATPPPAPAPAPQPMRTMMAPPVAAPPAVEARAPAAPSAASTAAPAAPDRAQVLAAAIAYAERARGLPAAELAQEIQRLGESAYAPLRATQLALALGQARNGANAARAQLLLQRVIADPSPDAQALQSFARLLLAQIADQRRADEQAERQAQQLREAQRRIEQLNDRLEAVRAIERSLPGPAPREPNRP
jgi:hypothetical protein